MTDTSTMPQIDIQMRLRAIAEELESADPVERVGLVTERNELLSARLSEGRPVAPLEPEAKSEPEPEAKSPRHGKKPGEPAVSLQIIKDMRRGEAITSGEAQQRYGASGALMGYVVKKLRKEGVNVLAEREGMFMRYRIADAEPPKRKKRAAPVVVAEPAPPEQAPALVLPTLGDNLVVTVLALDRATGAMILSLQSEDGSAAWKVEVLSQATA